MIKKKYNIAIHAFNAYLRFQPNDSGAYYCLGMCYKGLGNRTEARSYLERARDMGSQDAKKELETW